MISHETCLGVAAGGLLLAVLVVPPASTGPRTAATVRHAAAQDVSPPLAALLPGPCGDETTPDEPGPVDTEGEDDPPTRPTPASAFHPARYFDIDRDRSGPGQLAGLLSLPVADVFPIRYDLSGVAVGHPEVVRGSIDAEPSVRLTHSERMALILGR
jgi:hypothetical protein